MRILSLLVFGLSALTAMAAPNFVNLDAPGALEALSRDHPADYAKVVEAMERIQAVPYSPQGQHNLFADIRQPDPTRADIQTSFPGKAHDHRVVYDESSEEHAGQVVGPKDGKMTAMGRKPPVAKRPRADVAF